MTEEDIREALKTVEDPEAGMNIVDLGLVYGIAIEPSGKVRVEVTMTSPACPVAPYIVDESAAAIRALAPGTEVEVDLVWDPPWTPDRMSAEARSRFGWTG